VPTAHANSKLLQGRSPDSVHAWHLHYRCGGSVGIVFSLKTHQLPDYLATISPFEIKRIWRYSKHLENRPLLWWFWGGKSMDGYTSKPKL